MKWLRPVRPSDSLRLEGSVTETRPSRSHPDRGVVKFRTLVYNQNDELVLDAVHVILVQRRSSVAANPTSAAR
jgi:acyl dehydratase